MKDILFETPETSEGFVARVFEYDPDRRKYRDLWESSAFDTVELATKAAKNWVARMGEVAIPVEQPDPVRG